MEALPSTRFSESFLYNDPWVWGRKTHFPPNTGPKARQGETVPMLLNRKGHTGWLLMVMSNKSSPLEANYFWSLDTCGSKGTK